MSCEIVLEVDEEVFQILEIVERGLPGADGTTLPQNQIDALDSANNPSGANPFATIDDLVGIDYANPVLVTGAQSIPSSNKFKHHICSGTSADYTLNLPTTGLNVGDLFSFEMSGALTKIVGIDALAGKDIDGIQLRNMVGGWKALLEYDGDNWQKLSGVTTPIRLFEVFQTGGNATAINNATWTSITNWGSILSDPLNLINAGTGVFQMPFVGSYSLRFTVGYQSGLWGSGKQSLAAVWYNSNSTVLASVLETVNTPYTGINRMKDTIVEVSTAEITDAIIRYFQDSGSAKNLILDGNNDFVLIYNGGW